VLAYIASLQPSATSVTLTAVTLPNATARGRRICDEVSVYYHRQIQQVEARFKTKKIYLRHDDAPRFARLTDHHGRWHADIELNAFAPDEITALEQLAQKIQADGLEVPPMLMHVVEELRKL
jgi:hypothetical protein